MFHLSAKFSMENIINFLTSEPLLNAIKGGKTTCTKTINTKSAKNVHFDIVKAVFE